MNKFEGKEKQVLFRLYRIFYQKEPIFLVDNYESLTIEIQSMFYILSCFGVSSYTFSYNAIENMNMPISLDLQDLILELINNKEVIIADDFKNSSILRKVNVIAKQINEMLVEKENKLETLRLISSIMHCKSSVHPNYNDEQLAEFNNCNLEDVKKINRLSLKKDRKNIAQLNK